jgi:hypothetical protein
MGSPEAIAEKLWARLQIAQETPKPAFPEIADKAEAKAIIEAPVRAAEVVKA